MTCIRLTEAAVERPDGNWAWVVVLAAACIRVIVYGISYTSGVVYVVILEEFKKSKLETSWISSVITATTFITCPFSGVLVNRFGTRKVALVGGLIACGGLVASSFSTNLTMLSLCYGVVTGIGCGLTFIPGSVAVAKFFTKKRNIAMGVAAAGGGIGTFAFPPIITYLKEVYTWKGMFLIVGGIALNICVFGMLYRPVRSDPKEDDLLQPVDEEQPITSKKPTRTKNKWNFCKDQNFIILGISNFLFSFGASIIFGHLAAYAKLEMHIDESRGALLYSFVGVTVMFTKLAQGFLTQNPRYKCLEPYWQYIISYTISGVTTLFLLVKSAGYAGLVVYTVFFGAGFAASGGSIIPAILIDMSGLEQFSLTYGVTMFLQAIGYLLGSPVAGWMCDRMKSYQPSLVLASISMILSAVIVIFPCRNSRHKLKTVGKDVELEVYEEEINVTSLLEAGENHSRSENWDSGVHDVSTDETGQESLLDGEGQDTIHSVSSGGSSMSGNTNVHVNSRPSSLVFGRPKHNHEEEVIGLLGNTSNMQETSA